MRHTQIEGKNRPGGKDFAAFEALQGANLLVEILVGWAIDHVAGLAEEKRELIRPLPRATAQHPEYVASRAAADDHRHEINGSHWWRDPPNELDPDVAHQLLLNLLAANPGAFPPACTAMVIDWLEALNFGQMRPLLRPKRLSRKISLDEQQIHLQIFGFICYQAALGRSKAGAIEEVASLFKTGPNTVKSWVKRLRKELGSLRMDAEEDLAKEAADLDKEDKSIPGEMGSALHRLGSQGGKRPV